MNKDAALLARLKAGDRGAFAELIEEHSPQIFNLARRMMGDPAEAEEILQETFMQAVKHIDTFRGQAQLGTWLHRIATNQALMRLRRKQLVSVPLDTGLQENHDTEAFLPLADWSTLPESTLLNQEARGEIEKAIAQLPDNLRVVFILRDIQGLSTAETAAALDLSISAVKSRLMRARLKLRGQLSAYFGERLKDQEASDGD